MFEGYASSPGKDDMSIWTKVLVESMTRKEHIQYIYGRQNKELKDGLDVESGGGHVRNDPGFCLP